MSEHYTIAADALPYHYILRFEPNFKTFNFTGQTIVKLKVSKPTTSLKLNAKDLKIKSASIKNEYGEQKCTFNLKNNDEVTFNFTRPVMGETELTINYEGIHNDKLYGFYRSSYDFKGKKAYLLSTQFEAPNARAAFPCLDEPSFKATFDVSMLVDKDLETVSNMPIKSTKTEKNGKKLVTFQTSPKMSTYLLYLGVGKYDKLSGNLRNIKMTIFATKGKRNYLSLPLDYSKKFLADLEKYFRIKYPLPKLDFLAIPDFAAGAMENWGAITFRETALLGNEKETTVSGKQRIAEVVAHEIAHMWFGDLVTMKWWDDMWLNESFATFMEYKSVDRVFPKWKAMLKYYLDSVASAFIADGMKNTHPISVNVNTAGEISELFDAIGYNKGGSVLLMLEDFVGPEIFRDGLTKYLTQHSYGNATKTDLWTAIENECRTKGKDYPVIEVMDDWINREGYPIVSVKYNQEGVFELEQERFTISGNMKEGAWKIPISYISEKGEGKIIMDQRTATIKDAGSWIKLNYKQAGFYRVNYELKNLKKLGAMIKEKTNGIKLGDLDAWGIENDLFALVRSGQLHSKDYLDFVRDYCMDCGYPANVNISDHLSWITSISYSVASFAKSNDAKDLSIHFHRKILSDLGWEVRKDESSIDTKMRAIAISELGRLGEDEVVAKTQTLFDAIIKKGKKINPNLKRPIYYTVAFNKPDKAKFKMFLDTYQGNGSPEDKIIALQALAMLGDSAMLNKVLDLSLSKEIRLQDSIILSGVVASNPMGRLIYKKWAMKNWKTFMKKYDPSSHMLKNCVSAFAILADKKSYSEIEKFLGTKSNTRDDIKNEIKQTLERLTANIRFIERNTQTM